MPPTDVMEPSLLENIRHSNYLVIYDRYQKGNRIPRLLAEALDGVTPEAIIKIDGYDYVDIFKVSDLPKSLFAPLNR